MRAKIEIKMDNAAFGPDPCDATRELHRILRKLADEIESAGEFRAPSMRDQGHASLYDINGNRVGIFDVFAD